MRIGLSTSVIQRGQSGVGQYVLALVRAFLKHCTEHEFTLFTLENDLPLFAFAEKAMRLVPIEEKFRPPVRNIFWHQHWLPRLARNYQLDVLHVPSYRRLLWPRPCALVATIHDLAPFHVRRKYDRLRMFYGRVVARRLAHRQDEIIAISQNTARDLMKYFGVAPERLTIIYNGLDHQRFLPAHQAEARAAVAGRFGLEAPFFLYVARLEHPGKNHFRLLQAFNEFKAETKLPWKLALAGSDWHGAEVIHAVARQSPFSDDILSLGFVGEKDLPTLYRAAEVFVYPSLYEGFGLPILEAMACGCPVLCSDIPPLREVARTAALLVNPHDTVALKTALKQLAADTDLRQRLRCDGLEQARLFDWQETASSTLNVYERAMLGARRTPSEQRRGSPNEEVEALSEAKGV